MQCNERDQGGASMDSQWNIYDMFRVRASQERADTAAGLIEMPESRAFTDSDTSEQTWDVLFSSGSGEDKTRIEDTNAERDDCRIFLGDAIRVKRTD